MLNRFVKPIEQSAEKHTQRKISDLRQTLHDNLQKYFYLRSVFYKEWVTAIIEMLESNNTIPSGKYAASNKIASYSEWVTMDLKKEINNNFDRLCSTDYKINFKPLNMICKLQMFNNFREKGIIVEIK